MKRKNCYIYTRVSTSMQVDGFSLDAQKEKLRRYAEFQDFMIAGEYSDEGKSGKNIEGRPEFQTMLNDISEGKDNVQYVLVFKLSRFGRNAADVLNSLQLMQDYGVNLICVEDGIDSSKDSGKLMISVLSAVAEIERENILVQTMEGRKQKAREGKWNGGFAPYGYELIDGELKIAEDEAEIIRIIYDKFIHTTMGAGTVAKYLNRQGYIKKKRQNGTLDAFTAHFVKLVLDNPIYCGKIAFGRRKTEKIQGSRNEYHVVKQEEYPIYDGIHDAIISEEDWLLAQDKRKKTGIKSEKIYSTEHQHLLTGIIKCPICGAGLYGSVNRKRKKDGSFYRDYWYYACKHRLEYDGHKCTFKKQIHQEKINEAVVEVIRNIVKNSKFDSAIKEKLDASVDLSKYEKEEAYLMTQIRQLTAAKERLGSQIDRLDCSDRHYEQKYTDMQNRINSLYDEIAEANENLETVQTQIKAIKEQKISQKRIFEFLELFDIIYNEFTEMEKKEFLHSFIKKIEIYPEPLENGQILKSIQFRFPVYYQGNEADMFIPNFENTVETVVLLSHKKPDGHINVKVEFGEGEGKVPLDNIAKRAESYKPKERVTYKMIKEYIEAKYGFKVHTAYIAEVKRDLGLPMYDAPNAVEELKQPRKHPTAEKVEAIKDASKEGFDYDANWLMCEVKYSDAGTNETYKDACLLTDEPADMVEELSEILDGSEDGYISDFMEPYLKVAAARADEKIVIIFQFVYDTTDGIWRDRKITTLLSKEEATEIVQVLRELMRY